MDRPEWESLVGIRRAGTRRHNEFESHCLHLFLNIRKILMGLDTQKSLSDKSHDTVNPSSSHTKAEQRQKRIIPESAGVGVASTDHAGRDGKT